MPPSQSLPAKAVIVGIDASGPAHSALLWAAREATARELPLVVCHAYAPTDEEPDWETAGSARNRAWRVAHDGVGAATLAIPGVEAYAHAAPGPIQYVLRTAVTDPEVFVLGCHRRRESRQQVADLLLKSFEISGVARPVVLVQGQARGRQRPGRLPVVLAVDDSSAVRTAMPFALAAAAIRRTRVVVLPVAGKDRAAIGHALAGFERLARSRPSVPVTLLDELPIGGTVARLIRAADHAGLLVAPTAQGQLLGSKLAQFSIGRARCPIALVPRRT
ncbi:adenine nucleotide alpha hydrolase family protein [Flindersiella endophytica]